MTLSVKKLLFAKRFRTIVSVAVAISAGYMISESTIGTVVELNDLDLQFRIAQHSRKPDTNIVIVTIDQNSLQYFKRTSKTGWPWPRDFYALLTDFLSRAGAKAIVYDFQFTEPDEDRVNSAGAYNDSMFASAIRNAGNVYLAAILTKHDDRDEPGDSLIKFPGRYPEFNVERHYRFDKSFAPLLPFQAAAKGVGIVNFVPDEDGICRRIALEYSYQNSNVLSLSYNVYRDMFGAVRPVHNDLSSPYLIYWYGRGGPDGVFPYYSIHSVIVSAFKQQAGMPPDIDPALFKDKLVLIGSNAPSLFDLKNTPFTHLEPYPGVEIHATALSNFLNRDFIHPVSPLLIILIVLVCCALVSIAANYSGNIITGTGGLLAVAGIFFLGVTILFARDLIWMKSVFAMTSMVLTYVVSIGWNFATEGRSKRQIQKIFGQFVNPHVVKQLSADPELVELGGEEVEASVLFSDIEGFTQISETKKPKELVAFLNYYFSAASDIFLKHDGTIDKFIGDAVMVQFGLPLKNPDHRLFAVNAAYEFSRLVAVMTKEAAAKGEPVFSTRIGINSGPMVAGYIGGRSKKEYTVIGDTVNLASRLEGVNKYYGTSILISESTATAQVTDKYLLRAIDFMKVKGKNLPIKIFEVVCPAAEATDETLRFVRTFEEGVLLYRSKQWKQAIDLFRTVQQMNELDAATSMYVRRCEEYMTHPPDDEWDGVYVMTSK